MNRLFILLFFLIIFLNTTDAQDKLTKEQAFYRSGIKSVFWLSELDEKLNKIIAQTEKIYLNKNIRFYRRSFNKSYSCHAPKYYNRKTKW